MAEKRLSRWPVFSLLEPEFLNRIKIACVFGAAGNEAVVVTWDDEVFSLGSNCSSCLGVGDGYGGLQPRKVDSLCKKAVTNFAFGSGPHVLAVTECGHLYSWGHNGYSQLGQGGTTQGLHPTRVSLGSSSLLGEGIKVVQVACGSHHSLALLEGGEVYAWGYNNCGQVGSGTTTNQPVPRRVQTNIGSKTCTRITCGQTSSMALTDSGELFAWGYNGNGQLGVGNNSNQPTPIKVIGVQGNIITQIVCGYSHTLALTDAGEMFAWGSNAYGQLGIGSKMNHVSPVHVEQTLGRFIEIAACHYNNVSAAIIQSGKVYIWGQCRGQAILSPLETRFDNLDDVFACFAAPASMWRPLFIDQDDSGTLLEDMKSAFDDSSSSDMTIIVEEKPIHVHKSILRIRCEHFRSMFQEGHWIEADKSEITITQFTFQVYRAFLYYLYSDQIELPAEEAIDLLDLANAYCEDRLKKKCESLIKQVVTVDNVATLYEVASRFKADRLADFCFRFAMNHMTYVVQSEGFNNLEELTMKQFIKMAAVNGAFKT